MESGKDLNYKQVGERIKRLRIQKGISQTELAQEIGISQTHMSNIENGNAGISLWTAVKISRVLECSIDSFADEEKQEDKNKKNEGNGKIDLADLIEALKIVSKKDFR